MELIYLLLAWFAMDSVLEDDNSLKDEVQREESQTVRDYREPITVFVVGNQGTLKGSPKKGILKKGRYYKNKFGYYITNLASDDCSNRSISKADISQPSTTKMKVKKIELRCSYADQ